MAPEEYQPDTLADATAYELSVDLTVYDFICDPDEITKILDLQPSYVFRKGNLVTSRTIHTYSYNIWGLETEAKNDNGFIEEHLDLLLARIEPKIDNFKNLPDESKVVLSCGLSWYNHDERPGLSFTERHIKLLSKIKACIEISLF